MRESRSERTGNWPFGNHVALILPSELAIAASITTPVAPSIRRRSRTCPRRAADELRHLLPGMIQVVRDSAAKRGVVFISVPRCVAPCVSGGELISLRITERRFMQVVAVRCKFDQVALRHLTNLVRTEKAP